MWWTKMECTRIVVSSLQRRSGLHQRTSLSYVATLVGPTTTDVLPRIMLRYVHRSPASSRNECSWCKHTIISKSWSNSKAPSLALLSSSPIPPSPIDFTPTYAALELVLVLMQDQGNIFLPIAFEFRKLNPAEASPLCFLQLHGVGCSASFL